MIKVKRIINWKYVETAVALDPGPKDAPLRYGVKVVFNSGEWINLWYETEEQVQEFLAEMRQAFMYPCPGLKIISE